ncbi:MAG: LacI family transcriptional regulator [Granulosicoccus sp.]|nr:LacI family transcriptional regulator [Granulosicoccus sp.]
MSDRDDHRPTLKTIADLTGLSLSTVSLSLRGGDNLKPSTREKVAQAAAEIGYVPNRAGVRLRTGRTNVLALVLAADVNNLDFTRIMIQGIGEHIRGSRYHLSVVPEFESSDPVAAVRYILKNRSADGVLLTHTSARDPRVQMLMDADFPFVSHGRTEFYSPHPYHDFHAEKFVELAVDRLASKGRRRLLLAAVDNGTTNFANTVNGFKNAIARTELLGEVVENSTVFADTRGARHFGQSLAEKSERCDAIVCNNELTALAIIGGLQDKGLQLGGDYDLICKQTTEILPTLYPNLDTVAEDLFATGRELASLLLARIGGQSTKALQTLHEPIPHWRGSTQGH